MSNPLFEFSAIPSRPVLRLPGGATVAVWAGVNVEHYEWGRPGLSLVPAFETLVPDPINYGWRDYGARVGFWRLASLFEGLGIRATAMVNSVVAVHYPAIIDELVRLDWGVVAHGRDNSTLQATLSEADERAYVLAVTDELAAATGRRPRGWLGPARSASRNTNDILAKAGYTHAMDWSNDDQPYPFRVRAGRLVSVPYSLEVNDVLLHAIQGQCDSQLERRICDQFDVLREEGASSARILGLSLHPFISGQAFRVNYLRRALEHILRHEDVWWATSDEIADWYLEQIS